MTKDTLAYIKANPIIPVYYNDNPDVCVEVLKACYDGGIRVFEFTNRGANAPKNFEILLAERQKDFPDLLLGIGTIKTAAQADTYLNLGADFIVSPIVKAEVAQSAKDAEVFWIPGCMTPTEIDLAEELGAKLIKLFPGDTLGPGFLKAINPLFPQLSFMPTGGVDLEASNLNTWLNAGVSALGFGSKLFQHNGAGVNYAWLSERCAKLIATVKK